jgi:flavin-binding protein dodecin
VSGTCIGLTGSLKKKDLQTTPKWSFVMASTAAMKDHVYKILELVGSSEDSIEGAIQNAISRASKTIREMKWFEVVQTRGHIENGSVRHYQVTLRVGFTLED